ncbi:hypothetical protein D9M68_924750 [compost metagenome]
MEDVVFRERRSVHIQSDPIPLGKVRKLFLQVREQLSLPYHVAQNSSMVDELFTGIERPNRQVAAEGGGDWVRQ